MTKLDEVKLVYRSMKISQDAYMDEIRSLLSETYQSIFHNCDKLVNFGWIQLQTEDNGFVIERDPYLIKLNSTPRPRYEIINSSGLWEQVPFNEKTMHFPSHEWDSITHQVGMILGSLPASLLKDLYGTRTEVRVNRDGYIDHLDLVDED